MRIPPLDPQGRYGGRATSRPLPQGEPRVDALPAAAREHLAHVWLSQAATELRVARSFDVVHGALRELDADPGLIATAARAVDDEHRHATLCKDMAERYLGAAVVDPPDLPFEPPAHALAHTEDERRALYVVGQCAFNETFASAYLAAAQDGATVPLARAALRELMADEVDHARIGWAYLATLPPALKPRIEDWLLPLAIANLREWRLLQDTPHTEPHLVDHGFPTAPAIEEALTTALQDLILPGLHHFGYRTRPLATWLAQGAPT
jgi:hypothetical protein